MRPWPLLALLVALPAVAEESPFGGLGGLDLNAAKTIDGRVPAAVVPDRAAQIRAAHAELSGAGVPLYKLIEQRWSVQNQADLAGVIPAASEATRRLHADNPDAVGDFAPYKTAGCFASGFLTNLNQSIGGRLERGCLSHQSAVYGPARGAAGPSLTVSGVRYGLFPQHNAVIVFPSGTDWRYTGLVLDGWKCQSSQPSKMVYLYENWGGLRPVDIRGSKIEVDPNPGSAFPRLVPVD